jgi:hypothetical protein
MKQTLLEMVQEILSDMNSDSVNSIYDTIEATQVARIIKSVYEIQMTSGDWPHLMKLFKLASSTDSTKPTHVYMEDDVARIEWAKYDIRETYASPIRYRDVQWMEPKAFVDMVMQRDPSKDNILTVMDYHGTPLLVRTDHHPEWFTTFDDDFLVFDSYNSDVDSTIQQSKLQVFGKVLPTFNMQDGFVIDLPSKHFPAFKEECKSAAFLRIKEVFDAKSDDYAKKAKGYLSRERRRINNGIRYPNYGRK